MNSEYICLVASFSVYNREYRIDIKLLVLIQQVSLLFFLFKHNKRRRRKKKNEEKSLPMNNNGHRDVHDQDHLCVICF